MFKCSVFKFILTDIMYVLFFKNLYDFDRFIHKRKINIIDWLCKFVTLRRNFPKSYEIRFVGNNVDGLGVANLFPNLLYSVCDIMKRSFICDREHQYKSVVSAIPSIILKEKTDLYETGNRINQPAQICSILYS